ncbi:MAG: hypothetical protein K0B10_15580 [Vicingaceae bacterium]|nr:hypothetical protein [Vicingaceae bacterium]
MNQSEITLAKFKACLHSSMTKIGVFNLYEKKKLKEYEHSVFSKILIKYDLEEYDILLFEYFCDIIKTNNLNASSYYDAIVNEEPDNFRLELMKVYQFLHERDKDLTDSIVLKKSQTHTIKSEQLIFEIEKFINGLFADFVIL